MNYQVMPDLTPEEYAELKADIAERGVMVPVEFDENGNVLDGHHRLKICRELGITDYPKVIRAGLSEEGKRTHARKLNMLRRQLTREQKQELIRQQLKETPERSDNSIAKSLGVSDKTVTKQRKELEAGSEIPNLTTSTGADGKQYPRQVERESTGQIAHAEEPKSIAEIPHIEKVEQAAPSEISKPEKAEKPEEPPVAVILEPEESAVESKSKEVMPMIASKRPEDGSEDESCDEPLGENVTLMSDLRKQRFEADMKSISDSHKLERGLIKTLYFPLKWKPRDIVDAMLSATEGLPPDVLRSDIETIPETIQRLQEIYALLKTEAIKRGIYKPESKTGSGADCIRSDSRRERNYGSARGRNATILQFQRGKSKARGSTSQTPGKSETET